MIPTRAPVKGLGAEAGLLLLRAEQQTMTLPCTQHMDRQATSLSWLMLPNRRHLPLVLLYTARPLVPATTISTPLGFTLVWTSGQLGVR